MAGAKEIRTQIRSIKNTQKITKAMEMVAASKMRKAQTRMEASRPYAIKMRQVLGHVANANPEYRHPFLVEHDQINSVGIIIISTDRGLCGGLNVNLFKKAIKLMREWEEHGAKIELSLFGAKSLQFFKRLGGNIVAETSNLGDNPHIESLTGNIKVMADKFRDGELDRIYLLENEFVNTMTQRPQVTQLLPVPPAESEALQHHWDYLYEPDAAEVLDGLLNRYIESVVYQGVVENVACEMAARMVAMKAASDNAGNFIDELQLAYNKARQASITQEIAEIVGGAAAV